MNRQDISKGWKLNAKAREELAALLKAHPEILFVDAAIADIAGTLRGKRIAAADALKLFETGMQLPASLHLMDVRGEMMNRLKEGMASSSDPTATDLLRRIGDPPERCRVTATP